MVEGRDGAITVNRWPHGYAYFYVMLDDPDWPEGQAPHEIGRAQFGRISIANSDAEASPRWTPPSKPGGEQ